MDSGHALRLRWICKSRAVLFLSSYSYSSHYNSMSDVEKRDPSLKETSSSHDEATTGVLSEDTKSAGVIRIEAMYAQSKLSTTMRVLIVISKWSGF